jgi:hypothetical protein
MHCFSTVIFHFFWSQKHPCKQCITVPGTSFLKVLGTSWGTISKFHSVYIHILGTTVQNLVTQATWCPEFLQPCFMWLSLNNASSSFQKGQEGREKFGFQVRRLNPNSSKTNREKRKTKNYMMLKHKARGKLKRSFKEKQVQGNYVIIILSTGALFSSYTYRIFTWLYVEIDSTLISIKNLGLS